MSGFGSAVGAAIQVVTANQPDTILRVSPEMDENEILGTYTQINPALARAAELRLLGKIPLVQVGPGPYAENIVLNNDYIEFLTGAVVIGEDSSGGVAVKVEGAGSVSFISGLNTNTLKSPTPYPKDYVFEIASNAFCAVFNSTICFPGSDDPNIAVFHMQNDSAIIMINGFLGWPSNLNPLAILEGDPVGAPLQVRFFINSTFFNFNKPAIDLKQGNLTTWTTQPTQFNNCSIVALVPNNGNISFEDYTKAGLNNTAMEERRIILNSSFKVSDHLTNYMSDLAMWQDTYLESGDIINTMRVALNQIDAWQIKYGRQVENNSSNLLRLMIASGLEDWVGAIDEQYNNTTDVDASNSYLYKVDTALGRLELGKFTNQDNFEGYADTAALQGVYVASTPSKFQCYLETINPWQGSKAMELRCLVLSPSGNYVQRTYGTPLNLTGVCKVRGRVRANSAGVAVQIRLLDTVGVRAISTNIYGSEEWQWFEASFTYESGFNPANVNRIRYYCQAGTTGRNIWFDDVYFCSDDIFLADAVIDDMEDISDWASTGNITLSLSSTAKVGTSSMKITTTGFIHAATWSKSYAAPPYSPIDADHSAIHLWFYLESVTTHGLFYIRPELWTGGTGFITLPLIKIDTSALTIGKWYYITIPINRFKLEGGITSFDYTQVAKIQFTVEATSPQFEGSFLIDQLETGFAAQCQSVQFNKNLGAYFDEAILGSLKIGVVGSPPMLKDLLSYLPMEGLLYDTSLTNYYFNPKSIGVDPPQQVLGKFFSELEEWWEMSQSPYNPPTWIYPVTVRVTAIMPAIIDGWIFYWR